jgi:hypothetical protein
MAPIAYLPDFLGLLIWNLLNVIPLFIGVWLFPGLTRPKRLFFLLMVLVELITAVQNSQSNGLIAGLMLLAFVFLERNKPGYAALFILLTAFIKVFGIIACVLFIFYPGKFKSFAYLAICGIVLVVSPMLFVSPNQLVFLYKSWFQLMANDHSASLGLSVAGWIDAWFNIQPSKNMIVLVGFVMLCIPLLRVKQYNNPLFKKLFLASILTWIVIFNHKAESPTFVIAVTGIGIWYFAKKRPWFDFALLIAVVIFTELASTDLFPKSAKESFLSPFVIKVVPCILVWLKIIYEQIRLKNHSMDNQIQAE